MCINLDASPAWIASPGRVRPTETLIRLVVIFFSFFFSPSPGGLSRKKMRAIVARTRDRRLRARVAGNFALLPRGSLIRRETFDDPSLGRFSSFASPELALHYERRFTPCETFTGEITAAVDRSISYFPRTRHRAIEILTRARARCSLNYIASATERIPPVDSEITLRVG